MNRNGAGLLMKRVAGAVLATAMGISVTGLAISAQAAEPVGPTVLDSGDLSLSPKFNGNSTKKIDGRTQATFKDFTLGVMKRGDQGQLNATWTPATDTVIHIGDAEKDTNGQYVLPDGAPDLDGNGWLSTAERQTYVGNPATRMPLDITNASNMPNEMSWADGSVGPASNGTNLTFSDSPMSLVKAGVPQGGQMRMVSHDVIRNRTINWDSQQLASGAKQDPIATSVSDNDSNAGWVFTKPGTYCLTVQAQYQDQAKPNHTLHIGHATYTIVAGDMPSTVQTCAQEPVGDSPQAQDPERITVLDHGHYDLRTWPKSSGSHDLNIGLYGDSNGDGADDYTSTYNMVMAGTQKTTVPATTPGYDFSFIGKPGTPFYWYDGSGANKDKYLWPGLATGNWNLQTDLQDYPNLTFTGVSAAPKDGKAFIFVSSGMNDAYDIMFDSSRPMPQSLKIPGHTHMDWAFTQPGRYCLAVQTTAVLKDGTVDSGAGQLTIAAGVDPSKVVPCDRDVKPVVNTKPTPNAESVSKPVTLSQSLSDLQPYFNNGALDMVNETRTNWNAPSHVYNPDDVILHSTIGDADGVYSFSSVGGSYMNYDFTRIAPSAADGEVKLTLGKVSGPGDVGKIGLDFTKMPEGFVAHDQPWARSDFIDGVSKPGVYCVPVTASATPKGASAAVQSRQYTLTLVAGSDDPKSADYIDMSKVTSCSRGQEARGPDNGGSNESVDPSVNVPNGSLTDSGAVILNNGHVDVASRIEGKTLETWIKDTTTSNIPSYHPLAGSASLGSGMRSDVNNGNGTVFQLLPASQTKVPGNSLFSFLGKAGDPIYQVNQIQVEGLLWPGWSTEDIPADQMGSDMTWTLDKYAGPGDFTLYESQLGAPSVLMSARNGKPDKASMTIAKNAHVHGSWAFSKQGTYCLAFTRSTTLADGTPVSDSFTLPVAVGKVDVKKINPDTCFKDAQQPTVVDRTALAAAVAAAGKLKEADYTADSWAAFAKAVAGAKGVQGDAKAVQADVNAAVAALTKAQDGLVKAAPAPTPVKADKAALDAAVAAAGKLKQSDYRADSWAVFAKAVDAAKSVQADAKAVQADVDAAVAALTKAQAALVKAAPAPAPSPTPKPTKPSTPAANGNAPINNGANGTSPKGTAPSSKGSQNAGKNANNVGNSTNGEKLSATGSNVAIFGVLAAVLVLAGVALAVIAKSRRK
jgi:surface-anchored protein